MPIREWGMDIASCVAVYRDFGQDEEKAVATGRWFLFQMTIAPVPAVSATRATASGQRRKDRAKAVYQVKSTLASAQRGLSRRVQSEEHHEYSQ